MQPPTPSHHRRNSSTHCLRSTWVWIYSTNSPLGCTHPPSEERASRRFARYGSLDFHLLVPLFLYLTPGNYTKEFFFWGGEAVRFYGLFKVYGLLNMLRGLCWASCFFFPAHVLSNRFVLLVPNCPHWTQMAVLCSASYSPYSHALLGPRILFVVWLLKSQVVPGCGLVA